MAAAAAAAEAGILLKHDYLRIHHAEFNGFRKIL
jgi:hypothetical protein